jgi:hypothetical protein
MKFPVLGPFPKSKIRSQLPREPVKENAVTKVTPVRSNFRGPRLMNCLEARLKTAAGYGEETKVGRSALGLEVGMLISLMLSPGFSSTMG